MATHVVPGAMHVIAAARQQDGAIGLFYSRNPADWLVALAAHSTLGEVEVRPGSGAVRVVESLRTRFARSQIGDTALPWFAIDMDQVRQALADFDLERGCFIARAGIKYNDPVYVNNVGRGVVTGFTRCGRLMVKLDRPNNGAEVGAIAPRSQVKPILRAVAAA